jgi:hypothetical protein
MPSVRWSALVTKLAGPFQRHLEVLDLAEVTLQPARRLARGIDHDREGGR